MLKRIRNILFIGTGIFFVISGVNSLKTSAIWEGTAMVWSEIGNVSLYNLSNTLSVSLFPPRDLLIL